MNTTGEFRFYAVDSAENVTVVRADSMEAARQSLPAGKPFVILGSEREVQELLRAQWDFESWMDI